MGFCGGGGKGAEMASHFSARVPATYLKLQFGCNLVQRQWLFLGRKEPGGLRAAEGRGATRRQGDEGVDDARHKDKDDEDEASKRRRHVGWGCLCWQLFAAWERCACGWVECERHVGWVGGFNGLFCVGCACGV